MKTLGRFLLATLALSAAACSDGVESDLQLWMVEQRNAAHPAVEPVVPPKRFDPAAYQASESVPPFDAQRLLGVLRADVSTASSNQQLLEPELARKKDLLEAYPLDAIQMVGSLRKGSDHVALVRIDRLLHQVRVGDHMGQNFGKVLKVTATEISLREIVQDGAGEWIERPVTMQLQESSKP